MPAPQHDGTEHQLAALVPGPAETVGVPGDADGQADGGVGGDTLEDGVEDGEDDWITVELGRLDQDDQQDRTGEPPEIVRKLAAHLLGQEVVAGEGGGGSVGWRVV